ncbi:MAG: M23 family metallopeptidase [Cytophagaceae bacterium]|jgi:hypothetical protein|nr:M23 family metallopeptidase [Cytophagaceae bacterium]
MKKKLLIPLVIIFFTLTFISIYIRQWKATNDMNIEWVDTLSTVEFEPPPPPVMIYGFAEDSFYVERNVVGRNESLASILLSRKIDYSIIHRLAANAQSLFDVKKIRSGNKYVFLHSRDSLRTQFFIYEIDNIDYLVMQVDDSASVLRHSKPVEIVRKTGAGEITFSLWNAIKDNNLNPMLAITLSDIYAWTVDFFGIEKGDCFRVDYDETYVEGNSVGINTVHSALFVHHGVSFYAFRYQQDSVWGYFDEKGQSLRKAFLKAPLNFSRISSRFSSNRYHPVLKINRPHHGVDYAAPSGTPVYAIGDGRITRKGWDPKGGGNFMEIKHNSVYSSVYMHLSGFGKGVSKGSAVTQGQLIGYVGKTGLATGPHLDFRIYKNGSAVDPLKVEAPPVDPIKEALMPEYLEFIEPLKKMIIVNDQ